jgi:hypothetical protein
MNFEGIFEFICVLFLAAAIVGLFIFIGCLFFNVFGPTKEQIEQQEKMQVVQELDGCKVYRFYDKSYHYITRCGDTVTTRKNYEEYCGKACFQHKHEDLVTTGNN